MQKRILMLALLLIAGSAAHAQQIFTRGQLNSLLASSTTDDFETFAVGDSAASYMTLSALDHTTVLNGQGPGLVNPGSTYLFPGGNIQWNGNNYYNLQTKTIMSGSQYLYIDYSVQTQAFGIDLRGFLTYPYSGTVYVFDMAAVQIAVIPFNIASGGTESVFVGWQNDPGIKRVEIYSSAYTWSPIIDNHTYGVVPEPASLVALGIGLTAVLMRKWR